jgi:hypothetical protein
MEVVEKAEIFGEVVAPEEEEDTCLAKKSYP